MEIGQSKIEVSNFRKRTRVKQIPDKGQMVVRIVTGPIQRHFHMWPTQAMDTTTGMTMPTWRSVYVNFKDKTPLDQLAALDKHMKANMLKAQGGDEKEARSVLAKQNRFDYVVIERVQGEEPQLSILEANWTVYQGINKLATLPHPTNAGMLHHGLQYMYDIVITKGTNPKTHRPEYTVAALNCATEGKISMDYLDSTNFPMDNPGQYFGAGDLQLIENAEWSLETEDAVVEPKKFGDVLKEFPLDLGRTDKNNKTSYLFFSNQTEYQALETQAKSVGVYYLPLIGAEVAQSTLIGTTNAVQDIPGITQGTPAQAATTASIVAPVAEVVAQVTPTPTVLNPPPADIVAPVTETVVAQTAVIPNVINPPPADIVAPVMATEVGVTRPNEQVAGVNAQAQANTVGVPENTVPTNVATNTAPEGGLKKANLW